MSVLLIDAGNTRIKFAKLTRDHTMQALSACESTSSSAQIRGLLENQMYTQAVGVCVAGDAVREQIQAALGATPVQWLNGLTPLPGLRNDYATPHTLGADRWLAAYGLVCAQSQRSNSSIPSALVLASFGTATTVDAVWWDSAAATYVFAGGIILAGLATAWRSVSHSTAQLPDISALAGALQSGYLTPSTSTSSIPNSTESALQHGAIFAQIGAVAQLRAQLVAAHGNTRVWIAGGAAPLLAPFLPHAHAIETPVLLGLAASASAWFKQPL